MTSCSPRGSQMRLGLPCKPGGRPPHQQYFQTQKQRQEVKLGQRTLLSYFHRNSLQRNSFPCVVPVQEEDEGFSKQAVTPSRVEEREEQVAVEQDDAELPSPIPLTMAGREVLLS